MNPVLHPAAPLPGGGAVVIRFTLDGREVEAAPGETIWTVARREGVEIPHLCHRPEPGYRPDGNCRACLVEIEGERVLAASCIRAPRDGHGGAAPRPSARAARAPDGVRAAAGRPAGRRRRATRPAASRAGRGRLGVDRLPLRAGGRAARARPLASRHGGAARCLHPVRPLRARLPRGAAQRRHRPGPARHGRDGLLRPARPDGREHLRRLRRMRAGLPDRRAAAEIRAGRAGRRAAPPEREVASVCPYCGVGCQVGFRVRDGAIEEVVGPRRPGEPGAALREGPLRLRLPAPPRPADPAAGAHRGAARTRPIASTRAAPARKFREATLGGGDGAAPPTASPRIRDARGPHALAGFGSRQGLERGGLPVPEAGPHRLRHQQRGPLHAALPRRLASPRCWRASAAAPSPRPSWRRPRPR